MRRTEFLEKYPSKKFGRVNLEKSEVFPAIGKNNWGGDQYDYDTVISAEWLINLPHSCGNWEIGSIDDAKEFKRNLEEAIEYAEANPIPKNL